MKLRPLLLACLTLCGCQTAPVRSNSVVVVRQVELDPEFVYEPYTPSHYWQGTVETEPVMGSPIPVVDTSVLAVTTPPLPSPRSPRPTESDKAQLAPVPTSPLTPSAPTPSDTAPKFASLAGGYAVPTQAVIVREGYTLQRLVANDSQKARAAALEFSAGQAFRRERQGRVDYVVVDGAFPTRAAAEAALGGRPGWVRTWASVFTGMSALDAEPVASSRRATDAPVVPASPEPASQARPSTAPAKSIAQADLPKPAKALELWQAKRGESVKSTLDAWADRAQWTVHWLPDKDYRLELGREFTGSFAEVVPAFLDSLPADTPLRGALEPNHLTRTVVIEGTR